MKINEFHRQHIESHFQNRLVYSGEVIFDKTLVVLAFTNRCGSNMIADYLRRTEVIGGLYEHLNATSVVNMSQKRNAQSFVEHVESLSEELGRGREAVGYKASADQILLIKKYRIDSMFRNIAIIHVKRDDIFQQAVSYSIADQTKKWTSEQVGEKIDVRFDPDDISARVNSINVGNMNIRAVCKAFDLPVFDVLYEDFVERPMSHIEMILSSAGLKTNYINMKSGKLKKQADHINSEFVEKYKELLRTNYSSLDV